MKIYPPQFSYYRMAWEHCIVFTWGGDTYRAGEYFDTPPRGMSLIKARRRLVKAMNERRFKPPLFNRAGATPQRNAGAIR